MKRKNTKSEEKPKKVNSTTTKKTVDPQLPPMQMVKPTNKPKS
jgi:hypothetical protein